MKLDYDNKEILVKRKALSIEEIKAICNELDKELLSILKVCKIYVFGSYALNRASEYSDIDFIILTDNPYAPSIETTAILRN